MANPFISSLSASAVLLGTLLASCTPAPKGKLDIYSVNTDRWSEPNETDRFVERRNGNGVYIIPTSLMDESCVDEMQADLSEVNNFPHIKVKLKYNCVDLFAEITRSHIGQKIAIIIDGELISAPKVHGEIRAGSLFLEGNFKTLAEAEAIAKKF